MAKISFRVNGKNQTVDAEPDMPLLYALRNDLKLNGPKFGCGLSLSAAPARSFASVLTSLPFELPSERSIVNTRRFVLQLGPG